MNRLLLNFYGGNKIFFTVLYRSPSIVAGITAFDIFLSNIETISMNIRNENPYDRKV